MHVHSRHQIAPWNGWQYVWAHSCMSSTACTRRIAVRVRVTTPLLCRLSAYSNASLIAVFSNPGGITIAVAVLPPPKLRWQGWYQHLEQLYWFRTTLMNALTSGMDVSRHALPLGLHHHLRNMGMRALVNSTFASTSIIRFNKISQRHFSQLPVSPWHHVYIAETASKLVVPPLWIQSPATILVVPLSSPPLWVAIRPADTISTDTPSFSPTTASHYSSLLVSPPGLFSCGLCMTRALQKLIKMPFWRETSAIYVSSAMLW